MVSSEGACAAYYHYGRLHRVEPPAATPGGGGRAGAAGVVDRELQPYLPAGERAQQDDDQRAPVALDHFAERGYKATTIRGIAQDAGVSPSSVQHFFGTKDGLRDACDAYVAEQLRRGVAEDTTGSSRPDHEARTATHRAAGPTLRYLARALTEGSATAAALFDQILVLTEAYLTNLGEETSGAWQADLRDQAAVFAAMKLGVIVLHHHLSRALGVDTLAPEGIARVQPAILDIVAPHLRP
jgi:AcrR family transcriptional regulator